MTTADLLTEKALELATPDVDRGEAISQLATAAAGRRVAVVLARQHLLSQLDAGSDDGTASRALELLDAVLEALPT